MTLDSLRRDYERKLDAKARLIMKGCPDSDNPQLHLAPEIDANELLFVGK